MKTIERTFRAQKSSRLYYCFDGRSHRDVETAIKFRHADKLGANNDYFADRARRMESLSSQYERLGVLMEDVDQNQAKGPATRPVYCEDLGVWWASRREAVNHINKIARTKFKAKDVCTAIKRGIRLAGLRLSDDGPEQGKPESTIRERTTCRPVVCLEVPGEPFPSVCEAARHFGTCCKVIVRAIEKNLMIGQFHLAYADRFQAA